MVSNTLVVRVNKSLSIHFACTLEAIFVGIGLSSRAGVLGEVGDLNSIPTIYSHINLISPAHIGKSGMQKELTKPNPRTSAIKYPVSLSSLRALRVANISLERASTFSKIPSSRITSAQAIPAAQATGFPP